MNPWTILEIERTTEIKRIKRAYAKKLKTIVPDEQPREFQELKNAFDNALLIAKEIKENEPNEPFNHETNQDFEFSDSFKEYLTSNSDIEDDEDSFSFDLETNQTLEFSNAFEEEMQLFNTSKVPFSVTLQLICNEPNYFYDLDLWKRTIEEMDDWSIDEFMQNTYSIQLFLVNYFPILSKHIIHFLFKQFDLLELNDSIGQEMFVSKNFLTLRNKIYNVPNFSFEIVQKIEATQRKDYLYLRHAIYTLLSEGEVNHATVEKKLETAMLICSNDTDLLNLKILNFLKEHHGNPNTRIYKQKINDLLVQNKEENRNHTFDFLKTYLIFLKEKKRVKSNFQLNLYNPETLLIPQPLYFLLMGYVYYFSGHYDSAFYLWKKLSGKDKRKLGKDWQVIKKKLAKNNKKELVPVKIIRKQLTIKKRINKYFANLSPIIVTLIMMAIVFFPGFLFSNSERTSTPSDSVPYINYKESKLDTNLFDKSVNNYTNKRLNPDSFEYSFIETFYLSDDSEKKEKFINEHFDTGVANEHSLNLNTDPRFKSASLSDFTLKVTNKNERTILYFDNKPLCLLVIDTDTKFISTIYGEHWQPIDEDPLITIDDLEIPAKTLPEKFVYCFYITNNQLLEELFIYENIKSDSLKKEMREFSKDTKIVDSSMSDFSFTEEKEIEEDNILYRALYVNYQDEPLCAILYLIKNSNTYLISWSAVEND